MSNLKTFTVWYREGKFFSGNPSKAILIEAESSKKAESAFLKMFDGQDVSYISTYAGDNRDMITESPKNLL